MAIQVLILLSLICFSAFSAAFTPTSGLDLQVGSDTYQLGQVQGAGCGIQKSDGSEQKSWASTTGSCDPKAFFQIGSDFWVVLQITGAEEILTDANALTPVPSPYTSIIPKESITTNTVVIARITLPPVNPTNIGLFEGGSYFGTVQGSTFGGFKITGIELNGEVIQIKGDTPTGFSISAFDGSGISGATGTGATLKFNVADYWITADPPAEEEEEEEVQEEEELYEELQSICSAGVLSAASAFLTLVGVVAI